MQLDLFEYRAPKSELLLIPGNNFLLLPPRKALFERREILAAIFFIAAFFINSSAHSQLPQKAVLGSFTQPRTAEVAAASTIDVNEPIQAVPIVIQKNNPPKEAPKVIPVEKVYVPVLMYHHVGEPPTNNALDRSLTVSAQDFNQQIEFLKNRGYHSVTIAQIYGALEGRTALPSKPIALTFDDGYQDVFINAVPILKKHGFVGSFAICPSLLEAEPYATWGEVYLAHQDGMEIVSHSMNHIDFTSSQYSDESLLLELEGSKLFLESRISTPVDFFVYPYGRYNPRAMELVKKAGYKLAFTTELGTEMNLNKAFHLPRVRVHGQGGLANLRKVLGL